MALGVGAFADTRTATLVWEVGGDPAVTGTFLYWGRVADGPAVEPARIGLSKTVTNYVFTSLADDTTYYFYVTAYNRDGLESVPSNRAIFRAQRTTAPQAAALDLSLLTTNTALVDPLSFELVGGQPEQGSGGVTITSGTSCLYSPTTESEVAALRFRFDEGTDPGNPTDALVKIYADAPDEGAPYATPPSGPVLVAAGSTVDIPLLGRSGSGEQLVASLIDDSTIPEHLLPKIDYGPGLLRFSADPDYFGEFTFAYSVNDGFMDSPFATVLVRVVPGTTALRAMTLIGGLPHLELVGPEKAIYHIYRSQDLVRWNYLQAVVTSNGFTDPVHFLDPQASAAPIAFYRSHFAGYVP